MKTVKRILLGFAFFAVCLNTYAASTSKAPFIIEKLRYQKLVDRLYELKGESLIWFGKDATVSLRQKVKTLFDSAIYLGLDRDRYHYNWIAANVEESPMLDDSMMRITADRIYTDAVITFCKDIYGGSELNSWLGYDELREQFETTDNSYILTGLSVVSSPVELDWFIRFLEPSSEEYTELKIELRERVTTNDDNCAVKQLCQSLNVLRWIKHYRFNNLSVNKVSDELQLLCSWLW